jgi:hypothetical protein
VEHLVAVARDPPAVSLAEAAVRLPQIALQNGGPRQPLAEGVLPVVENGVDAGSRGPLPPAANDDRQRAAVEREIADEIGAEESRRAGEKQGLRCGRFQGCTRRESRTSPGFGLRCAA